MRTQCMGREVVGLFAEWYTSKVDYNPDWAPDCNWLAVVTAIVLMERGESVVLVEGDAAATDSIGTSGIHWWLLVNGRVFDPKEVFLRISDCEFRYLHRIPVHMYASDHWVGTCAEDVDPPIAYIAGHSLACSNVVSTLRAAGTGL